MARLDNYVARIQVSQTRQLAAKILDQHDNEMTASVVWSSDNGSVASVSSTGLVTGVAAGFVKIKASSSGKDYEVTIEIYAPITESVQIYHP